MKDAADWSGAAKLLVVAILICIVYCVGQLDAGSQGRRKESYAAGFAAGQKQAAIRITVYPQSRPFDVVLPGPDTFGRIETQWLEKPKESGR